MKSLLLIFVAVVLLANLAYSQQLGSLNIGSCQCQHFNAKFFHPVCGSDGRTYLNPICLMCAPGIKLNYYGKCEFRSQLQVGYGGSPLTNMFHGIGGHILNGLGGNSPNVGFSSGIGGHIPGGLLSHFLGNMPPGLIGNVLSYIPHSIVSYFLGNMLNGSSGNVPNIQPVAYDE